MNDAALLERRNFNPASDPRAGGGSDSNGGEGNRLTLKENALPSQIEMLQNAALNLFKEVQTLSNLETTDIMRGIKFYDEVERFERELIVRALDLTGGHQVRAARLLGLKVTTLNSKVKRYRVPLPHDEQQQQQQQQSPPPSQQPQAAPFPKRFD